MGSFKGLVDSVIAFFSLSERGNDRTSAPASASGAADRSMDGISSTNIVNERIAHKLKGYFELAKEQIDKAVRAEEWGMPEEAIAHYKNAERILVEAKATRAPYVLSSSEHEKVKSYHGKILKWHEQVLERLKVLSKRTGNKTPVSRGNSCTARSPSQGLGTSKQTHEPGGCDARLVDMINTSILDMTPTVKWDDVAGLDKAKQSLLEMVILPTKRRDLFTGLRRPARGLLLFGPPGNGKTMLAKAVASESEATFFNVSASLLTSKWVGEAEKLVKTLFMVAISRQPSVIFIDEIDSIMSARTANENDASRRLKSEFLIQADGVASNANDLVIIIGATNKPQELDDAVLRRLVKRIFVPLPDENVRYALLKHKLKGQLFSLSEGDLEMLVKETQGYSGSDLQALCEEAAMMPIRELGPNILTIEANQVRSLRYLDFHNAMMVIKPSIVKSKWEELDQWNRDFGSN